MFLHLGKNHSIYLEDVIAILNVKTINFQEIKFSEKIIDFSSGKPTSLIIADDAVYLSVIFSLTLQDRGEDKL